MSQTSTRALIIVVGPSGVGKSTFVDKIITEVDGIHDAITCTTRQPRSGEKEGNPYFFLTPEEFRARIEQGFFVEWAQVHDQLYGTPVSQIEEPWARGEAVIMDVDVQGAKTFKSKYPQALTIFIHPPSINILRQRIIDREGKVPHDLDLRLENARKEIAMADEFDRQMVNNDFEASYAEFKKIVEEHLNQS